MPLQSLKVIIVSAAGVALALLLTQYTAKYQFDVVLALPQVGVFLAACAGGPLWGVAAGIAGGLGFYYGSSTTLWLYVLTLMGLGAGLFAYRLRPAAASILAWLTFGLAASYYVYSQTNNPTQAFYSWLTASSYEVVAASVVVEAALLFLRINRVRKKKEAEQPEAAPSSEAQAEIGL